MASQSSLCLFDSPDLTRTVGNALPTYLIDPANTNTLSVTGSFTNGCEFSVVVVRHVAMTDLAKSARCVSFQQPNLLLWDLQVETPLPLT